MDSDVPSSVAPEVRASLLQFQRNFAQNPPGGVRGAVLDGRDIGTVVCPGALAKLFVTASEAARASRRHKELQGRGVESIYARVLKDMVERDARDRDRRAAPMVPAADALVIDTTTLDPDQTFARAIAFIRDKAAALSLRL